MKQKGFTLIEILVATTLSAIALTAIVLIFSVVLKNYSKENILVEARENGISILKTFEFMVRNAKSVSTCSGNYETSITLTDKNGNNFTFSCLTNQIASASAAGTAILTSPLVMVNSCTNFVRCISSGARPPRLDFDFTLEQVGGVSLPTFKKASINFKTSVGLRNY